MIEISRHVSDQGRQLAFPTHRWKTFETLGFAACNCNIPLVSARRRTERSMGRRTCGSLGCNGP